MRPARLLPYCRSTRRRTCAPPLSDFSSGSSCDQHPTTVDNVPVSRIFITGSTDGLGRAAARVLMGEGHDVVLHARSLERAAALSDLAPDAAGVVIGDLSSAAGTRELADQVNDIGRMDS